MSKNEIVNFSWDTKAYMVSLFEGESDLPVEAKTDQLAFEFNKLDDEISKLKEYKKAIESKIKECEANKVKTSSECAEYLIENGIDRLDGVAISSITLNKPKEATTTTKKVFKSIFKNKAEIEEYLVEQGMGRFEEVEIENEAKPSTLRINLKR
jgi:kynurenine formamidase